MYLDYRSSLLTSELNTVVKCPRAVTKLKFFLVVDPISHCHGQGQWVNGALISDLGDLGPGASRAGSVSYFRAIEARWASVAIPVL